MTGRGWTRGYTKTYVKVASMSGVARTENAKVDKHESQKVGGQISVCVSQHRYYMAYGSVGIAQEAEESSEYLVWRLIYM
jgi:hypothetical protein